MVHTRVRSLHRTAGLSASVAAAAVALSSAAVVIGAPVGRAARTLNVRDEGYLRFASSSGSRLLDEGHASGTMPGWVRVRFTYNGNPTVYAQFTIVTKAGSVSGHATGRLSNPVSPSPSFRGSLTIIGGSGRYAHASGSGELFGVFYRRSYGLTVQAISKLRY